MKKQSIADMMRYRAKELRTSTLDGNSKLSAGQCASILMEYVKLLELPDVEYEVVDLPIIAMEPLPKMFPMAYNGCMCQCHHQSGIVHALPCCRPEEFNIPAYWRITND